MAAVNNEKRRSFKVLMSIVPFCAELKGILVLKSATLRKQNAALINPMIRIAQGKPRLSARLEIKTGKIIPPMPPAVAAMPVARARRLRNQWDMQATLGVKTIDEEIPPRTLNPSINW
jgi:hypothetical protein